MTQATTKRREASLDPDDVLRRMLNTPHKPHVVKKKAKPAQIRWPKKTKK